jgi:hypothetical protein
VAGVVADVPGVEGEAEGAPVVGVVAGGAGVEGEAEGAPVVGLAAGDAGLEGDADGGTLGLFADVPGVGWEAAGGSLGEVSAFAGRASIAAKNGTASRLRNCGKVAERSIYETLVAQKPNARHPLRYDELKAIPGRLGSFL